MGPTPAEFAMGQGQIPPVVYPDPLPGTAVPGYTTIAVATSTRIRGTSLAEAGPWACHRARLVAVLAAPGWWLRDQGDALFLRHLYQPLIRAVEWLADLVRPLQSEDVNPCLLYVLCGDYSSPT